MNLYEFLLDKEVVFNHKEFHELVYNRQIKVDDEWIDDPKHEIDMSKKMSIRIGVLELEV